MSKKINYNKEFETILSQVKEKINFDEILNNFSVGAQTLKKHLKNFINKNPDYLKKITGFYPDCETIISLAEKDLGQNLNSLNLFQINRKCKEIVDELTKPIHENFLKSVLKNYIDSNNIVKISFEELLDKIYEDYKDHINESGNALVSIAGRMNEEILFKGLESIGLKRGKSFVKTGKSSEADLQINYTDKAGHHKILCVEIKSYHARERFLRGLRDIPGAEIAGAGFFIDAKEFNPTRSIHYARANVSSIYMPDQTFNELELESRDTTAHIQSKLYRPLSNFCSDMKYFSENGNLPKF